MDYMEFFSTLSGHVQSLIQSGGYSILFVITVIEGLPLIGLVVPGHLTIIASGFLAKLGIFSLSKVISISILGAVIGDCTGFYLGKRYGMSLLDKLRKYFIISDSHIARAQNLLHKHTGKAMIVGRFSPITRALMPFLVGANKLSDTKFWFFNIVSAILWVVSSVILGYVVGAGYSAAAGIMGKFVLVALAGIVIIVWGYRFINARYHLFAKYELFILALNLISLGILAYLTDKALTVSTLVSKFDVWVHYFVNIHHQNYLTSISYWLSHSADTTVLAVLGLVIGGWLAVTRHPRMAAIMLLTMGSVGIVVGTMKEVFARIRPDNIYMLVEHSFPSGHASFAAAFFIALAYVLAPRFSTRTKKEWFIVGCVIMLVIIGLSRVVLGVHWISDVLAGWAVGAFIATGSILFVRYLGALIVGKKR